MPAEDGTQEQNGSNTNPETKAENGIRERTGEKNDGGRQNGTMEEPAVDDFGLPVRPPRRRRYGDSEDEEKEEESFEDASEGPAVPAKDAIEEKNSATGIRGVESLKEPSNDGRILGAAPNQLSAVQNENDQERPPVPAKDDSRENGIAAAKPNDAVVKESPTTDDGAQRTTPVNEHTGLDVEADRPEAEDEVPDIRTKERSNSKASSSSPVASRAHASSVSEWSHQQIVAPQINEEDEQDEGEWQDMPAYATHRIYDDWGKVLAKEYDEAPDDYVAYGTLGGAGKGYTRVQIDDDAQSATSMDDNTAYLFKDPHSSNALLDEDDEGKDVMNQMQTTKELLTEGQRIAYVGLVRLSIGKMVEQISNYEKTKVTKKVIEFATEAMKMWGQKIMVRLYAHMEIDAAEQVMVEQLAEHGVLPADLTPALMQNARVKNPAKNAGSGTSSVNNSARPSMSSPRPSSTVEKRKSMLSPPGTPGLSEASPSYEEHTADELTVQDPSQIENTTNLDIDIRWTVLCDLFLLLIADSTYDARSRTLLEHVGGALSVDWQEVCRFEKRVTDALEMQEQADKENWNEEEHLESRKKAARRKRLMVMGLCTVGGGLIIGLSAGVLAPVIGAGLAAGFTTIGVAGTSTFLGGTGAAVLIGSAGTVTGSVIGVRASNRRTGAVKTFEYRPLFNNKRTNLIVTVSGWMTGKVDDVRLPFSTVDPIMGDIYSVNWEPEMLQSTGQTIQILATEALTQTIQQILASTMLTALMAGLSLPIVLTKLAYLIDNPWTVSLARADATGLILADSIIDRNLGVRPITLVGFSLGARVIFSCLKELARRGAVGLVQNAYLFGSPIVAKKEEYIRARTVVSGRFLNGYATNDWILGYLFRATSGGIMRVSGLSSVKVEGIENKDVTELVPGHMAYRGMMPTLLQEVGWLVDGLEFNEIEDPDPEDHEKRQRELINEIEAARHELDEKQQKPGKFRNFFSRKKAVRREWETYDDRSQRLEGSDDAKEVEKRAEEGKDVMFDVDAIRAEALKLALEKPEEVEEIKAHLKVREIEGTMPALKIDGGKGKGAVINGNDASRQTRRQDGTTLSHSRSGSSTMNGHASPGLRQTEEEVTMSFEADERPSLSIPSGSRNASQRSLPLDARYAAPERPALQSAATTPNFGSNARFTQRPDPPPSHNPWADEEEVEMSFE